MKLKNNLDYNTMATIPRKYNLGILYIYGLYNKIIGSSTML